MKEMTLITLKTLETQRKNLLKALDETDKMISVLRGNYDSRQKINQHIEMTLTDAIKSILKNSHGWGKTCKQVVEIIKSDYPNTNYNLRSVSALLSQLVKKKKIKSIMGTEVMSYYI